MITVIQQGLGYIGRETAKLILQDKSLELVGAVDVNPEYVGKDLGELISDKKIGIEVTNDADALMKKVKGKYNTVVLTTQSKLIEIKPALYIAATNGFNVISPAEELFYPEFVSMEDALYLDKLALENSVRIVGRGVNPGCLMDDYPLQVCMDNKFDKLNLMIIYRHCNTDERRDQLKKKIGFGLSREQFYELNKRGKLGHVGLKMSASYLADNMGLKNYKLDFIRGPVVRDDVVQGLTETCYVSIDGKNTIILDLQMYSGLKNGSGVEITGQRNGSDLHVKDKYCDIVNGDLATARILKELIPYTVYGQYGLNSIDYSINPHKLLKK